jgi:hypothetical protein
MGASWEASLETKEPKTSAKNFFYEAINDKAKDETGAHTGGFSMTVKFCKANYSTAMFFPKENPGYYALSEKAAKLIMKWSMNEWYETSTKDTPVISQQVENQI